MIACARCGAANEQSSKFCPSCGASLAGAGSAHQGDPGAPPLPPLPPAGGPPPAFGQPPFWPPPPGGAAPPNPSAAAVGSAPTGLQQSFQPPFQPPFEPPQEDENARFRIGAPEGLNPFGATFSPQGAGALGPSPFGGLPGGPSGPAPAPLPPLGPPGGALPGPSPFSPLSPAYSAPGGPQPPPAFSPGGPPPPVFGSNPGNPPAFGSYPGNPPAFGSNPGAPPGFGSLPGNPPAAFGPPPGAPPAFSTNPGPPPVFSGASQSAPPQPYSPDGGFVAAPPQPPLEPPTAEVRLARARDPESIEPGALRVLAGFLVSFEHELGQFWPLYQGANVVGRKDAAPGLDVSIDHPTTSSRHAIIYAAARPGRLKVEDTGSTNGTQLGDVQLERGRKYELREGETIRFGGYSLIVKLV